jgi:diguanylate cyclase (GGDEF)-like protein
MQNFQKSSQTLIIKKRLFGISILIFIGMLIFIYFSYQTFTVSLENERKYQTQNLSSSAMGIIQHFYHLELSGEIKTNEAKKYAIQALESATYGKTGYFWINGGSGELLMQPYAPERVGINQIDWTDANGKYIFREFINKAKSGGGWVSYSWPKPGSKDEYPKISYVSYFEPWDWVLGTGVYLDDMQKSIFRVVAKASGILFAVFLVFVAGAVAFINIFVSQLENLAIRDVLTSLYTKRFLFEVIPDILRKSLRLKDKSLAVIFMDIDHFKRVNDNYGHSMGDGVLRSLGEVIFAETRADDYCVRYGGEEVVVVGFYDDLSAAIRAADRIRTSFEKQIFIADRSEFNVTLSAGIAIYNGECETFEDTLERADKKLYEAKTSGRNRIAS